MPYPPLPPRGGDKNRVAADWFGAFDCTREIGNIDFCVADRTGWQVYMWAEAKALLPV